MPSWDLRCTSNFGVASVTDESSQPGRVRTGPGLHPAVAAVSSFRQLRLVR